MITIACDQGHITAHKTVLCDHSQYLSDILSKYPQAEHPIVILTDLNISDIKVLVNYMYTGELVISNSSPTSLLNAAQILKIDQLTADNSSQPQSDNQTPSTSSPTSPELLDNLSTSSNQNSISINNNNLNININNNNNHLHHLNQMLFKNHHRNHHNHNSSHLPLNLNQVSHRLRNSLTSSLHHNSLDPFADDDDDDENDDEDDEDENDALAGNVHGDDLEDDLDDNDSPMIHHKSGGINPLNLNSIINSNNSNNNLINININNHDSINNNNNNNINNNNSNSINNNSINHNSISNGNRLNHTLNTLHHSAGMIEENKNNKIRCHLCNIGLSDVKCLYRHVLTRHLPEKWGYKCEFCDREFSRDDHLMRHYTTKHKNMEFNRERIRETRRLNREMAKNFHDEISTKHPELAAVAVASDFLKK